MVVVINVDRVEQNVGLTVAGNVAALQHKLKLSDKELAQRAGLDRSYFAKLRAGKVSDPGYSIVQNIATALGVTKEDLVGGSYAATNVTQPLPPAYFAQEYGLTDPAAVKMLDELARALALAQTQTSLQRQVSEEGNEAATRGKKRRTVIEELAYRIFGQVIDKGVEEMTGIAPDTTSSIDPRLAQLIASWSNLSEELRQTVYSVYTIGRR